MQKKAYKIELLSAPDVAAACQLEIDSGLQSLGEAALLRRVSNSQSLLLTAIEVHDSGSSRSLIGMFSGYIVPDELEVDSLVVAATARRQGIGLALMTVAIRQAWQCGVRQAFLEVRESNLAATCLYKSIGFVLVGKRRDYYRDPPEDALLFRLEILDAEHDLNLRLS
ncbi:MAG: GNAT family N-acetyltransferase [Acidobacteria bacterium]|nr:GNAT family N-acetyltransferase [Acidobacteriota bacterium]MBI3422887.1 GNAT family N-acetyltransferase [Acidobacteriota bacterium]